MTDKQPAQFDWATELSDAQGHVTLSKQEAKEIGARLRSMSAKLKAYEDLGDAADDVQLLRMGYDAARLEIESLRARSVEPAGEYPALPSNAFNIDPGSGGNINGYSADQMRAYVDADRASRAPADSVTAPVGGETYHLGACIVEDMLHATVMRKEPGRAGAVTVLLSEQIPVEHLQDRDVIVNATPPAQAADSVLEDAAPTWRCQHCIDRHDGIYGSWAAPCPYHDDDGKPRIDAARAAQEGKSHG